MERRAVDTAAGLGAAAGRGAVPTPTTVTVGPLTARCGTSASRAPAPAGSCGPRWPR